MANPISLSRAFPVPGYRLQVGSGLDRALLVKFMQHTYGEISPGSELAHLSETVEQHLSRETPLWWVYSLDPASEDAGQPIACLWLGNATDQRSGDRHAYLLLLYVAPAHRRRGIATALLEVAHGWASQRGDRQIALQVFSTNQPALALYEKLGYRPYSLLMMRSL